MLVNNKLLIDNDCPMCKAYGSCFIAFKMVDKDTISPYQTTDSSLIKNVDLKRAKNEIALHDTNSNKTLYGLDALIKIITQKNEHLKKIAAFMYPFFLRCYKLISFNRKVIYPTSKITEGRDCTPDFNLKYRIAYIILVALFTGLILQKYAGLIYFSIGWESNKLQEIAICFGQILWQYFAFHIISKDRVNVLEYLGNMSTVSLIGGILLLPILIVHSFVGLSVWLLIGYFVAVVSIMFLEHIRRCKLKNFPGSLSMSWVLYRMLILSITLTINL